MLDRLVTEKLKAEAETIAAEGWKWISVAVEFPYGRTDGLRELDGKPVDLSPEEQTTIDALNAEQAKLESDYQDADELPDEVDQRLGEIEAALVAFEDRPMIYDPAEITRAGVFVSIDSEGRLSVDRVMSGRRTTCRQLILTSGRTAIHSRSSGRRVVLPSSARSSWPAALLIPEKMMRTRRNLCRIGSSPN